MTYVRVAAVEVTIQKAGLSRRLFCYIDILPAHTDLASAWFIQVGFLLNLVLRRRAGDLPAGRKWPRGKGANMMMLAFTEIVRTWTTLVIYLPFCFFGTLLVFSRHDVPQRLGTSPAHPLGQCVPRKAKAQPHIALHEFHCTSHWQF